MPLSYNIKLWLDVGILTSGYVSVNVALAIISIILSHLTLLVQH